MQQTHYTWPGSNASVSVQLHFDVIDKLLPEILSGIGATPRRAAERGGLLLGTVQQRGSQSVVYIEDFKPVACSHKTGPSYELSETDATAFDRAFASVRPGGPQAPYAVGFYRSHTREGLTLAPSDLEILKNYFPAPANVALIVKPFATRTSTAGFFLREGGQFPQKSAHEFAFKSADLIGTTPTRTAPKAPPVAAHMPEPEPEPEPEPVVQPTTARRVPRAAVTIPEAKASRLPGSLLFLVAGLLLGFFLGPMFVTPKGSTEITAADYALDLSVTRSGDSLNVHWNPSATPIKNAQHGTLEIEEAGASKPVDLDMSHLRNGNVVYPAGTNPVKFKLVIDIGARSSVVESANWQP